MNSVTIWAANWGDILLPNDFPTTALTVSGWYDKRYGIYPKLRKYIDEQDAKMMRDEERSGFRAPSFTDWLRQENSCQFAPNRLAGATINQYGCAV